MLQKLVSTILKSVKEQYPHIETPAAMRAVITSAKKTEQTYTAEIALTDQASGEKKEYLLEQYYYAYTVRIIDQAGNPEKSYPIIPNVTAKESYQVGSQVTVVFSGGELYPAIVGG